MKTHRVVGVMAVAVVLMSWTTLASFVRGADEAPAKTKKEPAEARGWLPMHYNKLVDGLQREAIYKIQDKYEPKLAELQKQIDTLEAQRAKEIEAVLRPDQLARLKELNAEADQARTAKMKESQAKKDAAKTDKSKSATAAK